MNTLTKLLIQLFFVNLIMFVPTRASTLQHIAPTTDEVMSDKSENEEPRTAALKVPLDKHSATTVYLTPTEKERLKDYLDTSSMDEFLVALLKAIRDEELPIRDAARDAMSHLFETEPSLATNKTLKLIEKNFLQGDADLWFIQGLGVLTSFAKVNNDLAPAVVKLSFRIIKKQIIVHKPIKGSNAELMLILFSVGTVHFNPHCITVLLRIAEEDMKIPQEHRNEYYRFLILNVLSHVVSNHTEIVKKSDKYLSSLFRIAFTNFQDSNKLINREVRGLFSTVERIDPAYSQDVVKILLHQAKKQLKKNEFNEIITTVTRLCLMLSTNPAYIPKAIPVAIQLLQSHELMSMRSILLFATIADYKNEKYDQQVFQALVEKVNTTEKANDSTMPMVLFILRQLIDRHPTWAKEAVIPVSQLITTTKLHVVDYLMSGLSYQDTELYKALESILKADPNTLSQALKIANEGLANSKDQVCLNSLQLLNYLAKKDPAHYEAIFQLASELVTDKNWEIRDRTLALINVMAEVYPSCGQRALDIATEAFEDKEKEVRQTSLQIIKTLVKVHPPYIPQACEIATHALQDKKDEVRRENIYLLRAILQADPSYAQKPSFKSILDQAKLDKNKNIRELADGLLSTQPVASKQ